jgi:spore maturation protein CgeB
LSPAIRWRISAFSARRGFLLAERTTDHQRLFREGIEAEFFEGLDELIAKCRYSLDHEPARRKIAEVGYRRCVLGGYGYEGRIRKVVSKAMAIQPGDASRGRSRLPSLPELASVALSS